MVQISSKILPSVKTQISSSDPSILPLIMVAGSSTVVAAGYLASKTKTAKAYKLWANTRSQKFHALSDVYSGYTEIPRQVLEKSFLDYKEANKNYQSLLKSLNHIDGVPIDDANFSEHQFRTIGNLELEIRFKKFGVERNLNSVLLGEHNAYLKNEMLKNGYEYLETASHPLSKKALQSPRDYHFFTFRKKPLDAPVHYFARIGETRDLYTLNDKTVAFNYGLASDTTQQINYIKEKANETRKAAGIPDHLNLFVSGDEAAHYAQFEKGKSPTYLINSFGGAKKVLDFKSSNPFARFKKLCENQIPLSLSSGVDGFEKGKIIQRQWVDLPGTRIGLGDALASLKATADFDSKFGRALSFTVKPFEFVQKHLTGRAALGGAVAVGALLYAGHYFMKQDKAA